MCNKTRFPNDFTLLAFALVFVLASVLGSCWWYSKRQKVSYKTALLVLWQDGVVAGLRDFKAAFLPTMKTTATVTWSYAKRLAIAFWEHLKPVPVKHVFTPDLYYGLYKAIREYVYAPFQPVIEVRYAPYPSAIHVAFYMKSAITTETTAEVVWHVQAAFQEYLTCYGLAVDYTAVPYVQDNSIRVWLYYCETPAEYPAYRTCCHQAMLMKADPQFRPLLESDIPETSELVLGYQFDNWQSTGQVVPIVWDTATAPHLMVSGPTGGGKTVFVKVLLERLLLWGAEVTVCDFKGFGDLHGFVKDYAVGKDCDAALAAFCADFDRAREQGATSSKKVLIFDEFGSFSATKAKKDAEELMRMLSNLVFMGRSYGYHIILVAQRFDADIIRTNLRDQFGVKVYMGSGISQQAATMLFPNSEVDKSVRLEPYCGYISTPKVDVAVMITPKVDITALDRRLKALCRKKYK